MVFTSPIFIFFFLPIVLCIYYIIDEKFKNLFLLFVSSLFYFYGEQNMILLMYFIVVLNFISSILIDYLNNKINHLKNNSQHINRYILIRKSILIINVFISISFLWYYKYWNFSINIFNSIFDIFGIQYKISIADKIILPLGISFYTFHILSYTFDVYFGRLKAEKNLLNLMTYVLMFPQLVAGPIVRYIDIKKQIFSRTVTITGFSNGIRRFCLGLGKKILIANTVAKVADKIFSLPYGQIEGFSSWLGAICYTIQIYFDFSGYSDMAIGLAMLFGFRYKENFNYPYISKTCSEFWRRWHISLSSWLRDYVYISLGGNRVSNLRHYINIFIVFLLSGLWHGANITFVVWGAWYGFFIILESAYIKDIFKNLNIKLAFLPHVYMFFVIVFGWVIFRSDSIHFAVKYFECMLGCNGFNISILNQLLKNDIIIAIILGIIFSFDLRRILKYFIFKSNILNFKFRINFYKISSFSISFIIFILSCMSIMSNTYNPFIYFRF